MLLNELNEGVIDYTVREVDHLNFDGLEEIGSGIQADVYMGRDVNSVIKKVSVNYMNAAEDAYVRYIKLISEHSNPFFPHVYSGKFYRERYIAPGKVSGEESVPGNYMFVVHMERLHEISGDKLSAALSELTKGLGIGKLRSGTFDSASSRAEIMDTTRNPSLREALRLMEPLFNDYGSDLHLGNFMVRLTGVGPQLVFADPFFGGVY